MVASFLISVLNFVNDVSQSQVQLFQSCIFLFGNFTVWLIMKNVPILKNYCSAVVLFLFNAECVIITNLALRDMMPSFIKVDLDNLKFFQSQILITFIFCNCGIFYDVKWLAFLNGPVMLLGSYYECKFFAEQQKSKNPDVNVDGIIADVLVIRIVIYCVTFFSFYMQQKDLSVLII